MSPKSKNKEQLKKKKTADGDLFEIFMRSHKKLGTHAMRITITQSTCRIGPQPRYVIVAYFISSGIN